MDKILDIKSLYKYYGNSESRISAINGISLEVSRGEFTGIMGASGSGKTTLLNVIATIDNKDKGSIYLNGMDVSEMADEELAQIRNEHLGLVFQDYNLLDTLTLYENIALALVKLELDASKIKNKILEIAEELGIRSLLDKYPYEVSGGQRQRCACARAIIKNPEIILADEPTGALDTKSSHDLLRALESLNKKYRATILMVTHDPVAASYCNRILILNDGKICAELYNKRKTKREFLREILELNLNYGGSLDEA